MEAGVSLFGTEFFSLFYFGKRVSACMYLKSLRHVTLVTDPPSFLTYYVAPLRWPAFKYLPISDIFFVEF
jgi:hypothetical protein